MIVELLHGMKGADIALLIAILLGGPTVTGLIIARMWRIQRASDNARYRRMVRRESLKHRRITEEPNPDFLPSRRYICRICGVKGRRSNLPAARLKDPVCPVCVTHDRRYL